MNNIEFSGCGTGIGNKHIKYGGVIAEYGLLTKKLFLYINNDVFFFNKNTFKNKTYNINNNF